MKSPKSPVQPSTLRVFGFQETESQPCADYYVVALSREEAINTSLAEQGHCCNISVDHGPYKPADGELAELLRDMPVFGLPSEGAMT